MRISPNVACVLTKTDLYPQWRQVEELNRATSRRSIPTSHVPRLVPAAAGRGRDLGPRAERRIGVPRAHRVPPPRHRGPGGAPAASIHRGRPAVDDRARAPRHRLRAERPPEPREDARDRGAAGGDEGPRRRAPPDLLALADHAERRRRPTSSPTWSTTCATACDRSSARPRAHRRGRSGAGRDQSSSGSSSGSRRPSPTRSCGPRSAPRGSPRRSRALHRGRGRPPDHQRRRHARRARHRRRCRDARLGPAGRHAEVLHRAQGLVRRRAHGRHHHRHRRDVHHQPALARRGRGDRAQGLQGRHRGPPAARRNEAKSAHPPPDRRDHLPGRQAAAGSPADRAAHHPRPLHHDRRRAPPFARRLRARRPEGGHDVRDGTRQPGDGAAPRPRAGRRAHQSAPVRSTPSARLDAHLDRVPRSRRMPPRSARPSAPSGRLRRDRPRARRGARTARRRRRTVPRRPRRAPPARRARHATRRAAPRGDRRHGEGRQVDAAERDHRRGDRTDGCRRVHQGHHLVPPRHDAAHHDAPAHRRRPVAAGPPRPTAAWSSTSGRPPPRRSSGSTSMALEAARGRDAHRHAGHRLAVHRDLRARRPRS